MKNHSNYSEFLKHENEITKLKIQAEFGLQFNGENNLNPAIENIWLNQILDFERSMVNNKQITIREKLGKPEFKPVAEINENNVVEELQNLMEILHSKSIVIDSVAGVNDKEMYRFIVEELLYEEVDSNSPANMLTCFIYEEFHPNDEYDIKHHMEGFLTIIESAKEIDFDYYLDKATDDEAGEVKLEMLKRKLMLFTSAFDLIEIVKCEFDKVIVINDEAIVNFKFQLSLLPAESRTKHEIKGIAKFTLRNKNDCWSIVDIEMPGVV